MAVPKIYLETTVFNFPFADDAPEYKQDALDLFAAIKGGKFEPYTSEYVTGEIDNTENLEKREKLKALISEYDLTLLSKNDEAERLAGIYLANDAVKATYPTDAVHIAMTAVSGLDFIVSLNFQHIVKQKAIVETGRINVQQGYKSVGIYTPKEALEHENG
jgi:predicted nucleic acid-binding protein